MEKIGDFFCSQMVDFRRLVTYRFRDHLEVVTYN